MLCAALTPKTAGYPWTGACSDYVSMVQSSWSVWNSKQHSTWSYPDFVMPQSNTQACNIFGAICQTGSITVDVNISSTISATEVDCSYYLTAQSYSNRGVTTRPYISTTIMYPWQHAFGQSPECSSFVAMEKPQRVSLSRCENPSSGYTDWDDYIPPGTRVLDSAGWDFFDCCGRCNFFAEEVRILYFPAANSTCTPSVSTNETTTSTISEPARLRFRQVDNAEGSIAIYSGVTL